MLQIHGEEYLKQIKDGEKKYKEFWDWWDSLSDYEKEQEKGK